jgi:hypothetical protein
MDEKNINKYDYRIDLFIVISIMACLIFIVYFANSKFNEIASSDREALLIEDSSDDSLEQQLADSIIQFRPDACKMIEVYSEKYEPIFKVKFKDDQSLDDSLLDHPDLIELFNTNYDGHTEVVIGEETEDIYFRWETTTSGEKCLFIIYMSKPIVENIWVFTLVCCIVMILVGILFLRLYMRSHRDALNRYIESSNMIYDSFLH